MRRTLPEPGTSPTGARWPGSGCRRRARSSSGDLLGGACFAGDVVPARFAAGRDVDERLDVDRLEHQVVDELDHEQQLKQSRLPPRGPDGDVPLDDEDRADTDPQGGE